jgi:exonuclease VII small subunit
MTPDEVIDEIKTSIAEYECGEQTANKLHMTLKKLENELWWAIKRGSK